MLEKILDMVCMEKKLTIEEKKEIFEQIVDEFFEFKGDLTQVKKRTKELLKKSKIKSVKDLE